MKITKEDLQRLIEDKISDSTRIQGKEIDYTIRFVRPDLLAKFLVENDIIKSE